MQWRFPSNRRSDTNLPADIDGERVRMPSVKDTQAQ